MYPMCRFFPPPMVLPTPPTDVYTDGMFSALTDPRSSAAAAAARAVREPGLPEPGRHGQDGCLCAQRPQPLRRQHPVPAGLTRVFPLPAFHSCILLLFGYLFFFSPGCLRGMVDFYKAIITAPTMVLVDQISRVISEMAVFTGLQTICLHSQTSQFYPFPLYFRKEKSLSFSFRFGFCFVF